jgi:hypothetical protein
MNICEEGDTERDETTTKDGVYLGKGWMSFEAAASSPGRCFGFERRLRAGVPSNDGLGDGFVFEREQVIERRYLVTLKSVRR